MTIELKKNCKYALVVPTSMGIRITPQAGQPVQCGGSFLMQVTSAESNVASVSSYLGLPVKILTTFVKGSPIAQLIKENLRSRAPRPTKAVEVPQGGPWGYRHQFNIADSGIGFARPAGVERPRRRSRPHAERQGFRPRPHLRQRGCAGRPPLRPGRRAVARDARNSASSLPAPRRSTAPRSRSTSITAPRSGRAARRSCHEIFAEIASVADILVGNEEDFQLCLGVKGPEAGGKGLKAEIDAFKEMIARVKKAYPNASTYATTLREVLSANHHMWGAIMSVGDQWYVVEPRDITVLDRIGGGDGFVGGLLYAMLRGWEPEKWVQFGWATGALATTMLTDYVQPADEDQIWSIWKGNARVQR